MFCKRGKEDRAGVEWGRAEWITYMLVSEAGAPAG